jgi:hypothetical protein
MSFLSRDSSGQTARERGQLGRHLRELEDLREEQLRDLGGVTVEMHQRDRFEGKLLWQKAAEIAAIDDEAKLVRRGLDEGLTLAQLEQLARDEASRTASRPAPA